MVPSDIIRTWLRAPLWMVPCPEGAMLMLDWALSSRGLVSEVLMSMVDSAVKLDYKAVTKLSFAQLLVSGAMVCDGPQTVIIAERNSVALNEVSRAQVEGCERTALLYGGLHGPDLDVRLRRDLGFKRSKTQWMTAWRIAVPAPQTTVANVAGALSLYLSLDALDWILTIQGLAEASAEPGGLGNSIALGGFRAFESVLSVCGVCLGLGKVRLGSSVWSGWAPLFVGLGVSAWLRVVRCCMLLGLLGGTAQTHA